MIEVYSSFKENSDLWQSEKISILAKVIVSWFSLLSFKIFIKPY